MIIGKYIYKLLKRGKIREIHSKLTIVNAKDSLCTMVQNFRPIVEFPGEALGSGEALLIVEDVVHGSIHTCSSRAIDWCCRTPGSGGRGGGEQVQGLHVGEKKSIIGGQKYVPAAQLVSWR
jgi:hypothetical protein